MTSKSIILAIAVLSVSCAHRPSASKPPVPPQPNPFERQIQNAIDLGDGDIEIRAYREKMNAEPDNIEVRLGLARLYQDRGYPEIALEHYRLAAARFPQSAMVQLALAKALRAGGYGAEAARNLGSFLKVHPQDSPEYASWLGILYDEQGEWVEGERAHRTALALAPRLDYLHNNLGYNLLKQGRADQAVAEFREALKLNPQSAVARNNLGIALANHPEEAVLHWQSVSDPATAHNNLAALLIEQGKYAEARRELDKALGYNKAHSAALENLRLVSRLDGKPPSVHVIAAESRWQRLKSALRRFFGGNDSNRRTSATAGSGQDRRGL